MVYSWPIKVGYKYRKHLYSLECKSTDVQVLDKRELSLPSSLSLLIGDTSHFFRGKLSGPGRIIVRVWWSSVYRHNSTQKPFCSSHISPLGAGQSLLGFFPPFSTMTKIKNQRRRLGQSRSHRKSLGSLKQTPRISVLKPTAHVFISQQHLLLPL